MKDVLTYSKEEITAWKDVSEYIDLLHSEIIGLRMHINMRGKSAFPGIVIAELNTAKKLLLDVIINDDEQNAANLPKELHTDIEKFLDKHS